MPSSRGSVLDPQHRAFVSKGVSIIVASRDAANRPVVCRGCGCEALDDGRLRVFVDAACGRALLDSVAVSHAVAAVFSEPATHRTVQFKGTDGAVVPVDSHCAALLQGYRAAFGTALQNLGYGESMAGGLTNFEPDRIRSVVFTPTAAFDQTPGPGAGEPMNQVQ
jgi:hypothetical protein